MLLGLTLYQKVVYGRFLNNSLMEVVMGGEILGLNKIDVIKAFPFDRRAIDNIKGVFWEGMSRAFNSPRVQERFQVSIVEAKDDSVVFLTPFGEGRIDFAYSIISDASIGVYLVEKKVLSSWEPAWEIFINKEGVRLGSPVGEYVEISVYTEEITYINIFITAIYAIGRVPLRFSLS